MTMSCIWVVFEKQMVLRTKRLIRVRKVRCLRSIFQTPPDLVVKFQRIDIVAVILWLVLRLHFVYQRQIEG